MGAKGLVRSGLLVAGALGVAAASSTPVGAEVDRAVFDAVNGGHGRAADAFFGVVTELGSIVASASAAGVLALAGRRRAALEGIGAASVMWLVGQAAKQLIKRPRPYDARGSRRLIGKPKGTSWPSSHPAVIAAFLTVAARQLGLGPGARAGLAGLATVVGVSRVYVGVHYPSDVVGGLMLGRAVADAWTASVPAGALG